MKKRRFSQAQTVGTLQEQEANMDVRDVFVGMASPAHGCRKD